MAYTTLKAAIIAAIKNNDNEEITGDILQGILLSIVNSVGSGYNFAGVATPSTNPGTPDGSMFWIGGKGIYANFGSTITVPAGFLGLFMWDGSAFSRQAIKLSGGDGIFDITAYTGSSYASLSAALAAVPQEVQSGGMTIRFVRSSDGKYVQYRLMATSFSSTEADWQGVDDVPIAGSDNLVTSGGIAEMYGSYIDSPEYVYIMTDKKRRILFAIDNQANFYFGAGCPKQIRQYIEDALSVIRQYIEDALSVKVNKEQGKSLIDEDYAACQSVVDSVEWLQITADAEKRVLEGITKEGKKKILVEVFVDNLLSVSALKVNGTEITNNVDALKLLSVIEDPEGRLEIKTDSKKKVLSYRDSKGVLHENAGIATEHLYLGNNAVSELAAYLKKENYIGTNDWSNSELVELPMPQVCAVVNIGVDSQAETKGVNIPTTLEYWDKFGNYFKKPIELNAQGSSSMEYHFKNQAVDFTDGSKIKFGNWIPFDSFHIKKYFIDVFRGQCIVAYRLTEQMYQTRPYGERRPWDYLNAFDYVDRSTGSFSKDYDTGALAHPDGFPVKVFYNGKNAGVYAFNMKKDRANYYCKKDKQNQIILDGVLGSTFWMANGDLRQAGEEGGNIWHDFEVRNPKIAKDINGNKYDGDNPTEPSDDYATTKADIERLTTAITLINAESTIASKKAKFEEFFNVPFLIDYELISQLIYNVDGYRKNWIWITNDGLKWCPTSYDMDSIFGQHWTGTSYLPNSVTEILGRSNTIPTGNNLLKALYQTELRNRYQELRDNGIFTSANVVKLLEDWLKACGYDNLKEDIETIVVSPYTINGVIARDENNRPILVPNTPSYRDGSVEHFAYPPHTGGWYNSLLRVQNWLTQRIAILDEYYNFNSN